MKHIYAEMGVGNGSFFSTEIEEGTKEYRMNRLMFPRRLEEIYLRLWVFRLVFILSFFKGIFVQKKPHSRFKLLVGLGGRG